MAQPILPDVYPTIQDGALGILPPPTDAVSAKIGIATSGPIGEIQVVTSLDQVRDIYGGGPLAEALAIHLALSGSPVLAVRANQSTAGAVGTPSRTATGTGDVALTGTPTDSFEVQVRITRAGNLTNAAFELSVDGGINWGPETAMPLGGEYPIPGSGLTIEFDDDSGNSGAFAIGDIHRWTTTAPAYNLESLNEAFDVLLGDPREFGHVHVVGAATPATFAGVAVRMQEAQRKYRFTWALLETAEDSDSNLLSTWSNAADTRVAVSAGSALIASPLTGRAQWRSAAWVASGRISAVPVSEHLGRVISGPVQGVIQLDRDEFRTPGLDAAGFLTMRTIIGRTGHYFTRGRMKAPEGSDYQFVESRRVMDLSCRVGRNALLRFMNDSVRVDAAGNILDADARAMEAYARGQLIAAVVSPGHASDVDVRVKRDTNVLSSRRTSAVVRILPLGYLEWIELDIGFINPAVAA